MTRVDLRETVDYETLETALIKAAEEMGWRAKVKDYYDETYRLGSVEEVPEHTRTDTRTEVTLTGRITGRIFPVAELKIYGKERIIHFFINAKHASEGKVEQYLEAVSRELYG